MAFDLQKLDAMLASYIEKKKLPGVSVAVRGPGGVVFEKDTASRISKPAVPLMKYRLRHRFHEQIYDDARLLHPCGRGQALLR